MDGINGETGNISRRGFLSNALMMAALAVSYCLAAFFAVRFLHPGKRKKRYSRMFVTFTSSLKAGESMGFSTPKGEKYLLTNTGKGTNPFQAYSVLCPHLGCKVLWENKKNHYICPCHQGIFNEKGEAVSGPPAKEGQKLKACRILVEGASIYALVEMT